MPGYNDIYMRDSLADQGNKPNPDRNWSASPDIIPQGVNPLPSGWQASLIASWAQDVGVNPTAGQLNYVCIRACNNYAGARTGTVQLYAAKSSLLLQPSQWAQNPISTATGPISPLTAASVGQKIVAANPFEWTPVDPSPFHWCLVALVGTADNPPPLPASDFTSLDAYIQWILDNPGAAQRNIALIPYPPPPSWQQSQNFGNPDKTAEEYLFQIDVSLFPPGTVVTYSCSDSQPIPPITATITVPQNGPTPNWLSCVSLLPARYIATLALTLQFPAGSAAPTTRPYVDYGRVITSRDHPLLQKVARPAEHWYPGSGLDLQVAIVGSCSFGFEQGSQKLVSPRPKPSPKPTPKRKPSPRRGAA